MCQRSTVSYGQGVWIITRKRKGMERELKYVTPSGDELAAKIEINRYLSNGCIYIGLLTEEDG